MRGEQEVNRAIEAYGNLIRRTSADFPMNSWTVFLKYLLSSAEFQSREHEKAWFIRVTANACRDLLKSAFRRRVVSLDVLTDQPGELSEDNREVLEAVLGLPEKYRDVIYLRL